jgi:hypothetical protein
MPRTDINLPLERWHACREAAQRQSEVAGGQAAVVGPCEPLQHELPAMEERILLMGYATTRAQPEGVATILRQPG